MAENFLINVSPSVSDYEKEEESATLQRLNNEINELRFHNLKFIKENKDLKTEIDIMKVKLNKISQVKNLENEILTEKLTIAEQNVLLKAREVQNLNSIIEKNKNQLLTIQHLTEENKNLSHDKETLNENIKQKELLIHQLQLQIQKHLQTVNEANNIKNNIQSERVNIINENMHLKEQNETLRNNNESYLKQINDLKKLNETLHNNLKQIDTTHLENYNKDLNKAIDSMKKKNDINIKSEVNSMELLYKAKIEFLTEQNNDLTHKVKTLNDTITSKSKAYDTLSLETSKQINTLNEQISYLTLQLQIRNEQCNSLTTFNDSNTQIIKQMNSENEALHEKLKVLKEELLTQAENHMQKQTKTKALLSLSETQNKNYEQIESELDKVLCNTTLISTNDESSIKFIKALNEIPTNNKRRISQCLLLAQRIQELSTNITKLNTEIKTLQTELTKTNQERDMYMSLADKVQQPYEKLLLDLKQQNDQIALLNNINLDNENKFKYIMERNTELENKNKELENDLKTVLGNRRKIDDLEYIVKSYLEEQQQLQELTKGKYGRSTFGASSKQKQK